MKDARDTIAESNIFVETASAENDIDKSSKIQHGLEGTSDEIEEIESEVAEIERDVEEIQEAVSSLNAANVKEHANEDEISNEIPWSQ